MIRKYPDTFGLALLVAALVALLAIRPALAFDPLAVFKSDDKPITIFQFGYKAYKAGRKDEAVGAFRYAATKNQLAAKWKLGRMYAEGDGVARDDLTAFRLYREIADQYSEIRPHRRDRTYVSNAVVAVADYYRKGIAGSEIRPNIRLAVDYYIQAAALYGNPGAQYRLGRIYLDGEMGKPQPVQAARWLRAAGIKQHPAAQAVLGRMLFEGNGVRRRRVQGLMLMTMAVGNNARDRLGTRFSWINEWREKAFTDASEKERKMALKLAGKSFSAASRHSVVEGNLAAAGSSPVKAPVSLLLDR